MSKAYSTVEAAFVLGMSAGALSRAVWERRVTAPAKGPGGAYHWTREDLTRASWQLHGHDLGDAAKRRLNDPGND